MQIEYLKSYNENKLGNKLEKDTPKGMSIAEIEALELEIYNGNKFPKAFREYLFIGGKWSCLSMNDGAYNKSNLYKKKLIKKRGVDINRPFVVFDSESGGWYFTFIYLDEGDNPQPYFASFDGAYDNDDGNIIWKNNFKTFSELIEYYVYLALNNLAP